MIGGRRSPRRSPARDSKGRFVSKGGKRKRSKSPKRKSPKRKSPKRKSPKRSSPSRGRGRKSPRRKSPKRKSSSSSSGTISQKSMKDLTTLMLALKMRRRRNGRKAASNSA